MSVELDTECKISYFSSQSKIANELHVHRENKIKSNDDNAKNLQTFGQTNKIK